MPNFHSFTRLPAELQAEIWKWAIRTRVIELDIPLALAEHEYPVPKFICSIQSTSRLNASKPTIAQVCHESRRVVLKNGGHLRELLPPAHDSRWTVSGEYPYLERNASEFDAWCSPGLDTIHLSWSPRDMYEIWRSRPVQPVQLLQSCNDRACRLSVYFEGILPFGPIDEKPALSACPTSTEILYFQANTAYCAVIKVFCIHLSLHDVIEAGLFDKGEQRVVLVDGRDTGEMSRYVTALQRSYSRVHSDDMTFLAHVSRRPNKLQAGGQWEQELRKLWVWSKWYQSRGVQIF